MDRFRAVALLRAHKFEKHLAAFLLILLPSVALYFAAQGDQAGWIGVLLGLIVIGNLLAMV